MAGHAACRVPGADPAGTRLTGAAGARAGRVTFIQPRQDGVNEVIWCHRQGGGDHRRDHRGGVSRRDRAHPAHPPNSGSTGARIIRYATVHRGQLLASYLLFALGLAVLMIFAAGLYRIIRRAEGQDGWLAIASLASVVAGAGIFGAGTALFMVIAYRPATDPAVARAFWDAGWLAYNSAGFAFVAWIVIVVVAALRHRALPRWTAWIGVPVALINLVGPFAVKAGTGPFSPQGWFALVVGLTFAVWLLAISLAAWRSARPRPPPADYRHPLWCACRAG